MADLKIEIVDYNSRWLEDFQRESLILYNVLKNTIATIHHIGSTSVPGLAAKPIIDILIELENVSFIDSCNVQMETIGYIAKGEFGIAGRRYFQKGGNNRTHQIHVFPIGDFNVTRHIAFRDYLIAFPEVASEYEILKRSVAETCDNDIDRYCLGKHEFVQYYEAKAVEWYTLNNPIHMTDNMSAE